MKVLDCKVCLYIWKPRYARLPDVCPRCHRTNWRTGKFKNKVKAADGRKNQLNG